MIWLNSILTTLLLSGATLLLSFALGLFTAITAWKSNNRIAFYAPLLTLAVPPWLLGYYLSDGMTLPPWIAATISLGVCCSVYFHTLLVSSLSNTAYKNYEMLKVLRGDDLKTLYLAVYPAIRNTLFPAVSLVVAEVLTDFGVSNYYGLQTLTMVTYNVWTSSWNMLNILPGLILLFVLSVALSIKDSTFVNAAPEGSKVGKNFYLSVSPTFTLLAFSIYKSLIWSFEHEFNIEFSEILGSLELVGTVLLMCLCVAALFIMDFHKALLCKAGIFFYALPSVVIASAFLLFPGPLTLWLPIAILVRYFGLAVNSLRQAEQSNFKLIEVMRVYASSRFDVVRFKVRSYKQVLTIGMCLVALDVLRELPISMILQPLNFSTLAMRMNYLARTEDLSQLGYYSLSILTLGLVLSITALVLNVKSK